MKLLKSAVYMKLKFNAYKEKQMTTLENWNMNERIWLLKRIILNNNKKF